MLVSIIPQHFAFSSSTSSALRISTACQSRRPSSASSVVLTQPAGWRALTSEKRPWPPDSADLSPLDYYFRGFANAEVWRQKPTTIAALKAVVEGVAASLNGEVLRAVMRIEKFHKWAVLCLHHDLPWRTFQIRSRILLERLTIPKTSINLQSNDTLHVFLPYRQPMF